MSILSVCLQIYININRLHLLPYSANSKKSENFEKSSFFLSSSLVVAPKFDEPTNERNGTIIHNIIEPSGVSLIDRF